MAFPILLLIFVLSMVIFQTADGQNQHGGNHSQTVIHGWQFCQPGRYYCGYQLQNRFLNARLSKLFKNVLYQCNSNGVPDPVDSCEFNCASANGTDAYCKCKVNKVYCGHEFDQLGWRNYYTDNNSLYLCNDGETVEVVKFCSNSCAAFPFWDSKCSLECESGKTYCGDTLHHMGFEGYGNGSVYVCEEGGDNISQLSICENGMCLHDRCQCIPGMSYCSHDALSMGILEFDAYYFNGTISTFKTIEFPNALFACSLDVGINYKHSDCSLGCQRSNKVAICKCSFNDTYCGHELGKFFGWTGDSNHTLYLCDSTEVSAEAIHECPELYIQEGPYGEAVCDDPISCKRNNIYCGRRILKAGLNGYDSDTLYSCNQQGNNFNVVAKCHENTCMKSDCSCIPGTSYCGSQLYRMGWDEISSNELMRMLWKCTLTGNARAIATCTTCNHPDGKAHCVCTDNATCGLMCRPHGFYCGHTLIELGLYDYDHDSLYVCDAGGKKASFFSKCDVGQCIHFYGQEAFCRCLPGRKYCGYEVGKWNWDISSSPPSDLAVCGLDGATINWTTCSVCIRKNDIASCLCAAGQSYCGFELNTIGFPGHESNTLYQCNTGGSNVSLPYTCNGSCNSDYYSHCECSSNLTYCGFELFSMGWKNIEDLDALYQCEDPYPDTTTIQKCLHGCEGKDGRFQCKAPPPIPWYWIVIGIIVPAFIAVLSFFLARSIIRARRLQKLVRRHRIDASQLSLTARLGSSHFGEVALGTYNDEHGRLHDVAVKISKQHESTSQAGSKLISADCFFHEVVALDFLQHKNIIKAFGICTNLRNKAAQTVSALVMEYMNAGSSIDYIRSEKNQLTGHDLIRIFIDICRAGKHLRQVGVAHRDIGARNVVIRKNSQTGKPIVAKLTDFGLVKDIGKITGPYVSMNPDRLMFHIRYTAPEGFIDKAFSSQSDVWSFGVFMWELYMLMNETPQDEENQRNRPVPYVEFATKQEILEALSNGHRLQRPPLAPDDMSMVMNTCWLWNPDLRPTFDQLLAKFESSRTSAALISNGTKAVEVNIEPDKNELVQNDASCADAGSGKGPEEIAMNNLGGDQTGGYAHA